MDEPTQHGRVDDSNAIEISHNNKRQAERHGKLAPLVAREDLFGAQRVLGVAELLPEPEGDDDDDADAEAGNNPRVGAWEIARVDQADEDEHRTNGEQRTANPVQAFDGILPGDAPRVLWRDCSYPTVSAARENVTALKKAHSRRRQDRQE